MSDPTIDPLQMPSSPSRATADVLEQLTEGMHPEPADDRGHRRAQRAQSRAQRYERRERRRLERANRRPDFVPLVNFAKNVIDDASAFLSEVSARMTASGARQRADAEQEVTEAASDGSKTRSARKSATTAG